MANFYSPIESVHNSDSEADEDELYRNKGMADVEAAIELLDCIDWKCEKIIPATGDRIQSIQRKRYGKIYRLTVRNTSFFLNFNHVINHKSILSQGQVKVPAKELFRKLYFGIDEMPLWNPTVLEATVIKVISTFCT